MEKKGIYNSKRLNTMKRKYLMGIAMLLAALTLTSCNDFLDITPTGKVIAKTGKEYRALLTYEYKNFPEDRGLSTLRSDEMTLSKNATSTEDYDSYLTYGHGTTSSNKALLCRLDGVDTITLYI